MADAGWYPDAHDPAWQIYFDGQNWTTARRPVDAPAAAPPPEPPRQQPGQSASWPPAAGHVPGAPAQWQPSAQPQPPEQAQQPQAPWAAPAAPTWAQTPAAPAWQQTPGQPGGWQQTPGQPGGWPQGTGPQWQQPAQSPPRRSRRKPLLLALVAVVVVAAGLITWLAWPSSAPSITYRGSAIASASDTLTRAESSVNALVTKRHGAKNSDTRCYFAQPRKPASGAKKSDIDSSLRCGPVLFVDGDTARPYLAVPLTGTKSGGKVTLKPAGALSDAQPQAVGSDLKLVRPDGKSAPSGSGGLKPPSPPGATTNYLGVVALGPTAPPPAVKNAVMVGRTTKVTIVTAGEITRFGAGDDARSAPAGQKLIAFQLKYGGGDVSTSPSAHAMVAVTGTTPRPVPDAPSADDWDVVAVPTSGKALLTLDDGAKQTLALPAGTPGPNNIAVLRRQHRTALAVHSFSVGIHLSNHNGSANITFHARSTLASIDYWIPGHDTQHASSPRKAILSINLDYTDSSSPGKTFGFDPRLLRLKLPSGYVRAKNVAGKGKIDDVFEVPPTFTTGELQVTGSEKVSGITVTVRKTAGFPISIPAG